jgi:hypothetical protein
VPFGVTFGSPSREAVATHASLPGRKSWTYLGMLTMIALLVMSWIGINQSNSLITVRQFNTEERLVEQQKREILKSR